LQKLFSPVFFLRFCEIQVNSAKKFSTHKKTAIVSRETIAVFITSYIKSLEVLEGAKQRNS